MPVIKDIKHRSVSEIIEAFLNFYKSLTGVLDGSIILYLLLKILRNLYQIIQKFIFMNILPEIQGQF